MATLTAQQMEELVARYGAYTSTGNEGEARKAIEAAIREALTLAAEPVANQSIPLDEKMAWERFKDAYGENVQPEANTEWRGFRRGWQKALAAVSPHYQREESRADLLDRKCEELEAQLAARTALIPAPSKRKPIMLTQSDDHPELWMDEAGNYYKPSGEDFYRKRDTRLAQPVQDKTACTGFGYKGQVCATPAYCNKNACARAAGAKAIQP